MTISSDQELLDFLARCPKCGYYMALGAPHDDGAVFQAECDFCGFQEGIFRTADYNYL